VSLYAGNFLTTLGTINVPKGSLLHHGLNYLVNYLVLIYVQDKYNIIPLYVYVLEKQRVFHSLHGEGPAFLVPEKRVLIRIFGFVLKGRRESASKCNSAFL